MSSLNTVIDDRRFAEVQEILERFEHDPAKTIPILQAVQKLFGYLPEETLSFVAEALGIPAAKLYGVATFYAHFTLEPKGKHVFRLCDGTACHVKHSEGILVALRRRLGLSADQKTTSDGLFTVETVSCLGACGLAPVMVVNEAVYGQVTPEQATAIVDKLIAAEAVTHE